MRRMIVGYFLFVPALFAQMTMPMPADQKPAAMPDCAAMMQKETAMQQHMANMNAKLQTLVDDMNKAKGSARIEKMEAVINELVTQRAMMQKETAMQQHMANMNAKLQTLVDDMNKAKGSARIEKMEAVINELVTQRAMMQKEMMDMQPQMMEHMMAHMQSAMMKGMADTMSSCPMMQQRSSPTPPPGAEPKH
jgi:predicted KAP-like P-loop ATPase